MQYAIRPLTISFVELLLNRKIAGLTPCDGVMLVIYYRSGVDGGDLDADYVCKDCHSALHCMVRNP